MLKDERIAKIEQYINKNNYATFKVLMKEFNISKATVRRDLNYLSGLGKVKEVWGGAAANSTRSGLVHELSYNEKKSAFHEEKKRIAQAANKYINEGDSIVIDSGTTCVELANAITTLKNINVATNDLAVAMALAQASSVDVTIIGGVLRKGFYSTTGFFSELILQRLHFNKAFISTDSIDIMGGCRITNIDEVRVKQFMIEMANEVILICDHSKFNSQSYVKVADLGKISRIITDKKLSPARHKEFTEQGITVELV